MISTDQTKDQQLTRYTAQFETHTSTELDRASGSGKVGNYVRGVWRCFPHQTQVLAGAYSVDRADVTCCVSSDGKLRQDNFNSILTILNQAAPINMLSFVD